MVNRTGRSPNPFNSTVETGLRMLVLLDASESSVCDLGRLVVYDYLLVHSDDVQDGPKSLHPATPHRSGELLVRRQMIRDGLILLISRELAAVSYDDQGITYSATVLTRPFLNHLESSYARELRERAGWVTGMFSGYANEALTEFAMSHLNDWGGELMNESLFRHSGEQP
jgi:hypothetical protein